MHYLPIEEIIVDRLVNSYKITLKYVSYCETKKIPGCKKEKVLEFCEKYIKLFSQNILITYQIGNRKKFFENYFLFKEYFLTN